MRDKSIFHSSIFYFVLVGLVYFCFNLHFSKNNLFLLYDSKRFYVAGVVLLACVWIILSKSTRYSIIRELQLLPVSIKLLFSVFTLAVLISTFNSNNVTFSVHYLLYYSGLFLLCCVLYQATHGQSAQIFKFNIVLSFLLFISVGFAFWLSVYFGQSVNKHTILSFSNPRFLNQVQVWLVIPLLYLSVLALKRQKSSRTTSFALMSSVAVIIATDARGISIALIATVLLWSLIDKAWRWQILLVSCKLIIAGFILKILFLSPLPSFLFAGGTLDFVSIRTDSPGRIQLWIDSLNFINFWGNGGGFFICTSENSAVPRFGHPHNSILQIVIEWGVFAVISYCLLLALLLYKVITTNRRAVRVSGLSLLSGFAYSFVSGVLVMPLSQLLAVLSIAIFWRCCKVKSECLKEKNIKSMSFLLMSLCLLIILSLYSKGMERVEMYQSGFLQNKNYEYTEARIDFWLGYNCNLGK